MSEKRRDGAWTEAARNDEVACGRPEEVPHPDGRAVPPSVTSAAPERIKDTASEKSHSVLAIAHRAGNSLAGLHRAIDLGADVIEADVHSYRGRLEVRHLKTMGPLPVLWDRWQLRSARAPRLVLEELLASAARGATFMLDLKGRHSATGEAVARQLHEFAPGNPVLVCSRYWPVLTAFEQLPWVRTIRSARTRAELSLLQRHLQRPEAHRDYGFSVHRSLLNPATVARLHRHQQVVMTWPVNDPAALAAVLPLRASGTIGVISDEPAILSRLLAGRTGNIDRGA